jgi:hypothetical protein
VALSKSCRNEHLQTINSDGSHSWAGLTAPGTAMAELPRRHRRLDAFADDQLGDRRVERVFLVRSVRR